jgi:hypothetical protein
MRGEWDDLAMDDTAVFKIKFHGIVGHADDTLSVKRTYAQVLAEPEWTERMPSGDIVRFRLDPSEILVSSRTGELMARAPALRVRYDRFDVWPWVASIGIGLSHLLRTAGASYKLVPWMQDAGASAMRIDFIQALFRQPIPSGGGINAMGRFIHLCLPSMGVDDWTNMDRVIEYFALLGLTNWILPPTGGPVRLLPGLTRRSHAMFARPATS